MRTLTFENSRGESITFDTSLFFIDSLTGIGEVDADLQSQKSPYQDGVTEIDTILDPRYIDLEGEIIEPNLKRARDYRYKMNRVCNPKLGIGKITLNLYGDIKIIYGRLDGGIVFPEQGQDFYQKFMITWECPSPYWQSPKITEEPAFEPRFRFPFSGPFIMGIQRDQRIINNDGDAPAPLQIEFLGPAVNPKIVNNTTGEYIKVNQTLEENERMLIDTTDGNKSVFFVDEDGNERDVFNWIDLGSTFFDLIVGENDITYTADSDIQGTIVNIKYNKNYVGV